MVFEFLNVGHGGSPDAKRIAWETAAEIVNALGMEREAEAAEARGGVFYEALKEANGRQLYIDVYHTHDPQYGTNVNVREYSPLRGGGVQQAPAQQGDDFLDDGSDIPF